MRWLLLGTLAVLFIFVKLISQFSKNKRQATTLPQVLTWINPLSLPVLFGLVPKSLVPVAAEFSWFDRHRMYEKLGHVPLLCVVSPTTNHVYVADPTLVNEIIARRKDFPKPLTMYRVLDLYGKNVVTTEGDEWKRHRSIAKLSEKNNETVHLSTVKRLQEINIAWNERMLKEGDKKDFVLRNVFELTSDLSLSVIAEAGFGVEFPWGKSRDTPWPGHRISFHNALTLLMDNLHLVLLTPKLLYWLPFKTLQATIEASNEFSSYMADLVARERNKDSSAEEGATVLSALVKSEESQLETKSTESNDQTQSSTKTRNRLSDSEVIGNTFILLVAGFETTSTAVYRALIMLAMYPEQQQKIHKEVLEALGEKRIPTYEDYSSLSYVLCFFLESLRLYPVIPLIPKMAAPDSAAKTIGNGQYRLEPGTTIFLDVAGVHTDKSVWGADANEFRPERWDGRQDQQIETDAQGTSHDETGGIALGAPIQGIRQPSKGAFISFSEGPRSCLGRKFFQIEAVAILATLCQEWEIRLVEEDGWTFERALASILDCENRVSMRIKPNIPLRFVKRSAV